MDQELENMLQLNPVRFEPVNLLRVGVEGAEAKYGAVLDENLARAMRLIEYLERRGFTVQWYHCVSSGLSTAGVVLHIADESLLREVTRMRPPLLVDGSSYLVAVLATRSILAGIRRD